MNTLFVNLDKKQYFSLQLLGVRPSWYSPLGRSIFRHSLNSLSILLGIEGRWPNSGVKVLTYGSWRGDQIAIVNGGDRKAEDLLPDDVAALISLGASAITMYAHVRAEYADVTEAVLQLGNARWEVSDNFQDTVFDSATRGFSNYSWLTPDELNRILDQMSWEGEKAFVAYCKWLQERPGLPETTKELLTRGRYGLPSESPSDPNFPVLQESGRNWHTVPETKDQSSSSSPDCDPLEWVNGQYEAHMKKFLALCQKGGLAI